MIEIIVMIILIAIAVYVIALCSALFIGGIAYSYWGLSIGMAPVLWILMGIGVMIGLISILKNAFKAARDVQRTRR